MSTLDISYILSILAFYIAISILIRGIFYVKKVSSSDDTGTALMMVGVVSSVIVCSWLGYIIVEIFSC